ncbi:MAG: ECF transporter S component [Clostridiales bacterium]|nr:ECF transporter S component [Clostridiales bacterium]
MQHSVVKPDEQVVKNNKFFTTQNICLLAMLSCASFLLIKFLKLPPLPFFPSFLQIHFSYIPILLACFMLGMQGGLTVVVIRSLLGLLFGSDAAYIDSIADFIIGVALVLPTCLIYSQNRTRRGALLAMLVATAFVCFAAILLNRFLLIPLYVQVYFKGDWDMLLGMVSSLYPNITLQSFYNYYLWLAVLPFNLAWAVPSCIITFFLYRPLELILKQIQARQKVRYIVDSNCEIDDGESAK